MNLIFWDPEIIAQLQEDKPHIIEWERHHCNCEHCEVERENFKCSVCGREEEYEFDIVNDEMKCKSCKTVLLSVIELKRLKQCKIKSYTPITK